MLIGVLVALNFSAKTRSSVIKRFSDPDLIEIGQFAHFFCTFIVKTWFFKIEAEIKIKFEQKKMKMKMN